MVQAHNGFADDLGNLREDLSVIRNDLSSLAQNLSRDAVKQYKIAKKQLQRRANEGMDTLQSSLDGITENGKAAMQTVQKRVTSSPLMAMAAAVGTGIIIGKLLGLGKK